MGWFRPSVATRDDHFEVKSRFSRQSMRWDTVRRVYGEKIDKITYEEIFLIVEDIAGSLVPVGELDNGFSNFEVGLLMNVNKFPKEWRGDIEKMRPGDRILVWEK